MSFTDRHNRTLRKAILSDLKITFNSTLGSFFLDKIRHLQHEPIYDQEYDFFYMELSEHFCNQVTGMGIEFLTPKQRGTFPEFLLVHYSDGVRGISIGRFYNSNPLYACVSTQTQQHITSTKGGSSGAPLVDSTGDAGFVCAMHLGTDAEQGIDYPVKIEHVIRRIKECTRQPVQTVSWSSLFDTNDSPLNIAFQTKKRHHRMF